MENDDTNKVPASVAEYVTSAFKDENLKRKKRLKDLLVKGLLALVVVGLGYKTFYYSSDYSVRMDKADMYLVHTEGWKTERRQIKLVDGKWQLRYDFGDRQIWGEIYTPFEARYNDNYKFIFTSDGNLFWVSNDKISTQPVKFIGDAWCFESISGEWISFDSMVDTTKAEEDYDPRN